ncbi:MAG: Hsp70 family protein, partial [Pseudomonadota bacterium]
TSGVHIGGSDYDREISLDHAMPVLGRDTLLAPGPMAAQRLPMPNAPFIDLATWHRIPFLYTAKAKAEHAALLDRAERPDLFARYVDIVAEHRGHELAIAVEEAKIAAGEGEARLDICGHAEARLDLAMLGRTTRDLTERVTAQLDTILARAGVSKDEIETLLWMGGSSLFSPLREAMEARLPGARSVSEDLLGSVSRGLVLDA